MPSNCPKCQSENIYQDSLLWICPECFNEWTENDSSLNSESEIKLDNSENTTVKDSSGNILINGDSVIVIKDLKIKGSSSSVKSGTKVRNIKIYDAGDGHNISCKIDGLGSINLKSEFVRKV